jgi:hypothetical protein
MNSVLIENRKGSVQPGPDAAREDANAGLLAGGMGRRLLSEVPSSSKPLAPTENNSLLQLMAGRCDRRVSAA